MQQAQHFHVAGYLFSKTEPPLAMDSHNRIISEETLKILAANKNIINKPDNTIVIERDYYYDMDSWREDILKVREALSNND